MKKKTDDIETLSKEVNQLKSVIEENTVLLREVRKEVFSVFLTAQVIESEKNVLIAAFRDYIHKNWKKEWNVVLDAPNEN